MADSLPLSESTIPSSPPGGAIFSDGPERASSPPSSPPGFPWELQENTDTATKPSKPIVNNAFSVLGKRKPLATLTSNERPSKKSRATPPSTKAKPSAASLSQTQLSLGQPTQIKCQTCGMSYVPSSSEDRALHTKYHKQNLEGYDVGKDFVSKAFPHSVYRGADSDGWVCAVHCHDRPARKRRAQAVLEIVQRELGAVELDQDELWDSKKSDPEVCFRPKWIALLYVKGGRCIGFLLAEVISEAFRVEEPPDELTGTADEAQERLHGKASTALESLRARQRAAAEREERLSKRPLRLSKTARVAKLGIARIWTSPTHRGKNIAATLLDRAIEYWNDRVRLDEEGEERVRKHSTLPPELRKVMDPMKPPKRERIESKNDVAFSQPTEAGRRLATRWYGTAWGWGVQSRMAAAQRKCSLLALK
ncbi:uncharacterized protein LTR77_003110 [Saxophila tyrrhenica]|uniref:Uncharacterized protein n=1 Tax=Saxophila tyrrhenica TaxID=1690608 RepID=A0AAV9PKR8_9PEZI|nr:hypothetical protein LTR77_003110 [Saxophila tyrrhenica]